DADPRALARNALLGRLFAALPSPSSGQLSEWPRFVLHRDHASRTPEIIHLAHSCLAVSGSVGLELLYQRKPSVIVYRISRLDLFVCRLFKTSPYISLVNLLAGKELYPEYLTDRCEAEAMSGHVLRWLKDATAY